MGASNRSLWAISLWDLRRQRLGLPCDRVFDGVNRTQAGLGSVAANIPVDRGAGRVYHYFSFFL